MEAHSVKKEKGVRTKYLLFLLGGGTAFLAGFYAVLIFLFRFFTQGKKKRI
jgi:hypothetical protein